MAGDFRLQFLEKALTAARDAQHIFPEYAACEAALESRFGESQLARADNNLFGMKQHRHRIYGSHTLPTREFEQGEWITVRQEFVKYPGWQECFEDRMATLLRLAPVLPHYHAALNAGDGETFVREASSSWSTDPERARKVLEIYEKRMKVVTAAVGV